MLKFLTDLNLATKAKAAQIHADLVQPSSRILQRKSVEVKTLYAELKFVKRKALRAHVRGVEFGLNFFKRYDTLFHKIPNEMEPNVNMFCAVMKDRILA